MAEGVEEALQSALSLRRPWKALQSSPSAAQLKSIVADRRSKPWRSVEDLRPDLHQPVIDGLQRILDRLPQTESESRMTALESLQAISALSGRLPQRMIIRSVESDRDSPSDGGGFGDVFFGRAGSKNVALKVLRIFRGGSNDEYERSLKVFRREALLWYQLRHPHILSLLGVNTTTFEPRPCLVSPFMKNGNVNQFLDNNPTHDRLQMMIDIMEGIHFLHTHDPPLVHADIRGANILVKDDLTCCLADFGLSMICDSLATSSRIRGGPTRWLAPEVLLFSVGDNTEFPASDLPSRDMYAFACTAIEICSRKYPFSDVPRDAAVYQEVVKRRRKPLPPPTTYLPQRVWDVVYRCLEYEAMSRPNAGLVLKTLKVVMAMPIKLDRRRLVVGVQVQDECDTNTLSTLSDTFMPLEWNGTRKYSSVTIRSLPESKTKPDAHCVHRSVSWSISTPSRIPSLLSWSDIDPSSFPREIRRKVEDIILQPCTKPWEDVHMIRPELYQIIMDSLQVALDHLPAMESGFARHAAIKCLQAISRISDVLPSDLALQDVQELRKMPIEGGGFANIYDGMYRSQRVCLKVLKVLTSGDPARVAKAFCRKALLWRQLHHPRILPLLCMTPYTRPRFCLVSPWMHNGNVNQFLRKHPTSDKLKMLTEIIEGIEYLHTHDPPIVHADIRGASILVKDDFTCCLAEFGLTTAMGIRTIANSWFGKGSLYWMSPEVWNENVDADVPARDIYSFGCTVIELYSGQHPFPGLTIPARIYHEVVVMKHKPPRPIELYDPDLWAIVDRCLAFNPRERPTASDVIHMLDTYA